MKIFVEILKLIPNEDNNEYKTLDDTIETDVN